MTRKRLTLLLFLFSTFAYANKDCENFFIHMDAQTGFPLKCLEYFQQKSNSYINVDIHGIQFIGKEAGFVYFTKDHQKLYMIGGKASKLGEILSFDYDQERGYIWVIGRSTRNNKWAIFRFKFGRSGILSPLQLIELEKEETIQDIVYSEDYRKLGLKFSDGGITVLNLFGDSRHPKKEKRPLGPTIRDHAEASRYKLLYFKENLLFYFDKETHTLTYVDTNSFFKLHQDLAWENVNWKEISFMAKEEHVLIKNKAGELLEVPFE